jgi:hypothetical protein
VIPASYNSRTRRPVAGDVAAHRLFICHRSVTTTHHATTVNPYPIYLLAPPRDTPPTMLSRTATQLLRRTSSSTIKSVLPPLSAVSSRRSPSLNPSNVRSFSATNLRREEDATRQEINTPPSLYTFTEEEEMLRDTGTFGLGRDCHNQLTVLCLSAGSIGVPLLDRFGVMYMYKQSASSPPK